MAISAEIGTDVSTVVEGLVDKVIQKGLELNGKERSFLVYCMQSTYID